MIDDEVEEEEIKNFGDLMECRMQKLDSIKKHLSISDLECPICLRESADTLLPCMHVFCDKCIADWYGKSGTCPVCRVEKSEVKEFHLLSREETNLFPLFFAD